MNQQFFNLITKRRNGEITRQQFCHEWAKLQGFNNDVKGIADNSGVFLQYRGREINMTNNLLIWRERGRLFCAESIKEMKIKIDTIELKAALNDGTFYK